MSRSDPSCPSTILLHMVQYALIVFVKALLGGTYSDNPDNPDTEVASKIPHIRKCRRARTVHTTHREGSYAVNCSMQVRKSTYRHGAETCLHWMQCQIARLRKYSGTAAYATGTSIHLGAEIGAHAAVVCRAMTIR